MPENLSPRFFSVAYANGSFVAVGYDSYDDYRAPILVGADGIAWNSADLPLDLCCGVAPRGRRWATGRG